MTSDLYLGASIALLSAVFFASSGVTTRRGVYGGGVYSTVLVSIVIGIPMYILSLLFYPSLQELRGISPEAVALFMLAGIVHFVIGRFILYYSIHYMGASASYPIMSSSNVLSAVVAIPLLGEILTGNKIVSVIIVSLGIYLMARGNIELKEFKKGFPLALMTAFVFAASSLIVRAALLIVRAPILGVLISYITSFPFLLGLLASEEYKSELLTLDKNKVFYILLNGVLVNLGQLFRYVSLDLVEVSIVGIVFSITPLLTIFFSYIVNRDIEIINRGIVFSALLIVMGIIIILL